MQVRKEEKQTISYSIIEKQVRSLPIVNDLNYDISLGGLGGIKDILIWLPGLPEMDIPISPSLRDLNTRYAKIIELAKTSRCHLASLYQQLFVMLWTEDNILQLKNAMRLAVNQGKIRVSMHYRMDDFFKRLANSKQKIETILQQLPRESKETPQQKSATHEAIEKSQVVRWLMQSIEESFAEGLQGWGKYQEVRDGFYKERAYSSTLKNINIKRLDAWERLFKNIKATLPKDDQLYETAMVYEDVNKNDLESMIAFINAYEPDFTESFKKKVNQITIAEYIKDYYNPSLPEEKVTITCLPVKPCENSQINYRYDHVVRDFTEMRWDWAYVSSLDESVLKDFYRVAALQHCMKSRSDTQFAEVGEFLINKQLTPEAQVAVVQAALDCFSKIEDEVYRTCLQDYVKSSEQKYDMTDPVRKKLLGDLIRKEQQYSDASQYATHKLARTLFLRLIAVNYIRNKLLTGQVLKSKQITHELVSQFGDEIIKTRRIKESRISKILRQLDIPSVAGQGLFEKKEQISELESKHRGVKNLRLW